tara:strand:+ start:23878 stop:24318 length:441 start_codon:yes stop_codon:yes gene_type:complete
MNEQLKAHLLDLSDATDFRDAAREWRVTGFEITDRWGECPCGHRIKEHCHIENKVTGGCTHVGNVCVEFFTGMGVSHVFNGVKRLANGAAKTLSPAVIDEFTRLGHISYRERQFLLDVRLKRSRSPRQGDWEDAIHRRIIKHVVKS